MATAARWRDIHPDTRGGQSDPITIDDIDAADLTQGNGEGGGHLALAFIPLTGGVSSSANS
jgi:hypothetical protein